MMFNMHRGPSNHRNSADHNVQFQNSFEHERYWFHNEHISGVVKLSVIIMIKTIFGTKLMMSLLKNAWDTKFPI